MKNKIREELDTIAPALSKFKAKETPPPPEGYFEGLEARMFERIEAEGLQSDNPKTGFSFWKKTVWVPAAASVLLIAALWWSFGQSTTAQQDVLALNLSESDIENFILEHTDEFDQEELYTFIENDNSNDSVEDIGEEALEAFSDEELEEFL